MNKEKFSQILEDLDDVFDISEYRHAAAAIIAASNIYSAELIASAIKKKNKTIDNK